MKPRIFHKQPQGGIGAHSYFVMTDFAMYAWTVDNSMCIYEIINISIEKEKYKIMYYPVSFLLQIKYVIPYVALFFTKTQLWLHMRCYLIYFTIPETMSESRWDARNSCWNLSSFDEEFDVSGDGLSKTRSLSDQPASCPLCGAILRQSRNLRRHLELLHFGLGNSGKSGIHARHRRSAADRANDFGLSSLACVRPTARIDSHLAARSSEASDFSMMTPLSIASSVSSASSVSLPGESHFKSLKIRKELYTGENKFFWGEKDTEYCI